MKSFMPWAVLVWFILIAVALQSGAYIPAVVWIVAIYFIWSRPNGGQRKGRRNV